MSIILKALKKAESASGAQTSPAFRPPAPDGKSKRLTILVAACTVVLGFFLATYLFRGSTPPSQTAPAMQAAPKAAAPSMGATIGAAPTINADSMVLISTGRSAEAETLLSDAVKRYPGDPYLFNHLGLALKKQGKLAEGAMAYEKAIELKPDYFIAMNNLAVALEALGNKDRARDLYEEALKGNPALGGAHLNYALLLENLGKTNEAEDHYHTFLTLSDDENLRGLVRRRLLALR